MADNEKYKGMTDHDLLITSVTQQDDMINHLSRINGRIENHTGDIIRLKIVVACIIAGSGAGIGKILTVVLGG